MNDRPIAFRSAGGVWSVIAPSGGPVAHSIGAGGGRRLRVDSPAAINPLRRLVQTVVDRRFTRTRYDPQRVVSNLGDTFREATELPDVSAMLAGVATRVSQPESIGVWLREGA